MVPGNFPLGCSAAHLTTYETTDKNQYDSFGCLKWLNEFSEFYNQKLQHEIHRLRVIHPHANIIYADYYNAALPLYRYPKKYGFTGLKACCGIGNPYNYNASNMCGKPGVPVCGNAFKVCCGEKVISNPTPRPFDAIFNFGDSLSDAGNFLATGASLFPAIGQPPYGETFFRHATGRCSDGRLAIDFIAEAYGLPYLQPYLKVIKSPQIIRNGVNFAVAGATALDVEFFNEGVRKLLWTNHSLNIQLGWFKKLKPSFCTTKQDCDSYFKRSLFVVGEIGGNDYNYAAFAGDVTHLPAFVPLVVKAITKAIDELIAEGAVEVLVPGNLPVGCSAVYLTLLRSNNTEDYDENGCLKAFNGFAKYHNMQLNIALETLRKKNPHARIMYADYFGAAKRFFHAPRHYGFTNGALSACCGGGGRYNFNNSARCGYKGSKVCVDPSACTNWDGIHLTEAAYRHIAKGLINGPFSVPPLKPAFVKIA